MEHHPDATLAEARNRILASADCEYVVYLDGDDELEPGYAAAIRRGLHDLRPGENVLLAPAVRFVRDSLCEAPAAIPNKGRWPQVNEAVIGTAAPRRLLLEVGGFGEWRAFEDYAVWLRCVAAGARLVYVEDAVYRAHVSANGRNQVEDGAKLCAEIAVDHRAWAFREGFRPLL